ncbi:hypothetical protein DRO91_05655 [Candidatus Heimdallarchaeota archaeon]|nr:MAG: hypothetical protein DRO91_05655 [Candidatus Heimdallarchaeota archaeon]
MIKKLWEDPYEAEYNPHVDRLTGGKIKRHLKIGFSSYWFSLNPVLDDHITKNSKEAVYLKHFLKLGYVYWLGLSPKPFNINHPRAVDCSLEFKEKLPNWDKKRFGTTPNYMAFCITQYRKKLGIQLPQLDFVFMNLMPTFVRRNARNYVLLHEYAIRTKTPVLAYSIELALVYQGVKDLELTGKGRTEKTDSGKLMNISGYDYRDKKSHIKMAPNMIHLVQADGPAIKTLQNGNPLLTFCTWWLPYDKQITKQYKVVTESNKIKYPISYVGNDNRRRSAIAKWFGKMPDGFVHMFGGKHRKELGPTWPDALTKKYPNIKWNPPVEIKNVGRIYNKTGACMNLAMPAHEAVGCQTWRHIEAPLGGCPLLLPNSVANAKRLALLNDDWCVVTSPEELQAKTETLIERPLLRKELVELQRDKIKSKYTMENNLRHLFKILTKRIGT